MMSGFFRTTPHSYIIHTYGCQMNKHDSEHIAGVLEKCGYVRAGNDDEAEVIILNTCSVRKSAEQKVWGKLGTLIDKDPGAKIIGVAGCMAQVMGEYIIERSPAVNIVFGLDSLNRIQELIEQGRISPICDLGDINKAEIDLLPCVPESSYSAWVPVSHGCDNNCSYCIVPRARGRVRSRELGYIISEVKELAGRGIIEIVLLGQNVNSYGNDLKNKTGFEILLDEVAKVRGLRRVKFETSHPADMNEQILKVMANNPNVCEYLHLPAQSGSNRILEAMNRKYSREYYLNIAETARNYVDNLTLSTDIIVGFPGETEEDFMDTMKLLEQVRFDNAFVFKYSEREGTGAAGIREEVPDTVKTERLMRLGELQDKITENSLAALSGRIMEVLIDGRAPRGNFMKGRTRGNQVVLVNAEDGISPGTLALIKINGTGKHTARGEIVKVIRQV